MLIRPSFHTGLPVNHAIALCTALLIGTLDSRAATYYVSPTGNDGNAGTREAPFKTFQKVVPLLQGGDTLFLTGGRYSETMLLENIEASLENPITLRSVPGEQVILDGTVEIGSIADGDWRQHNGRIYKRKLREEIWQVLIDDQEMIRARWPNASINPKADNYIWGGRGMTSHTSPESGTGYGTMVDSELSEFPYSLDGAMAVMNQRFRTFSRFVKGHEPGGDTFTYDRDIDQRNLPPEKRDPDKVPTDGIYQFTGKSVLNMRYYLEGKLEFLDAPGEWFFDKASLTLFVHTLDGKSPESMIVRGKIKDFGLDVADCKGIIIDGLDFFGCTFQLEEVLNCEIRNCNLKYYAALRRMLGEEVPHLTSHRFEGFVPTQISAVGGAGTELEDGKMVPEGIFEDSGIAVRNCRFSYGEGTALKVKANQIVVENCRFTYCDWSCSGLGAVVKGDGYRKQFRRLEFEWCPRSETMQPGTSSLVELCDFGKQLGLGQEDGSNIEASHHFDLEIRRSWFHDNTKFGPRFDGSERMPERCNGKIHHNVCFNMNSINPESNVKRGAETIKVKGDAHWVVNNTLLNITGVGIGVPKIWKSFGPDRRVLAEFNAETIIRNNICRLIASDRIVEDAEDGKIPPAGIVDHNIHEDAAQYLRDPVNRDFRPKAKSELVGAGVYVDGITPPELKRKRVDIGAYQHDCKEYWIPGFQEARASKPIPADGAENAQPDSALIWLGGYQGKVYEIYIGVDREAVEKADTTSPLFRGRQVNNIYVPKQIPTGRTCYWRIDTIKDGETVAGAIWQFKRGR